MLKIFGNNWISIYRGFDKMSFRVGRASYFDNRMHINFAPSILIPLIGIWFTSLSFWSLIWIPFFIVGYGYIYLNLPIRSNYDESEPPEYGFYFYGDGKKYFFNSFWLCLGRKTKSFYMPWEYKWVRTSVLKKDGTWEHETQKNRKDFWDKEKWKDIIWSDEYFYVYNLKNGETQERIATLRVEEREWRWRRLMRLPYPKMISKSISVEFSYGGPILREVIIEKNGCPLKNAKKYTGEIGESTKTYKGGTIGCSYSMLPGETPLQTLRRMEKERIFN